TGEVRSGRNLRLHDTLLFWCDAAGECRSETLCDNPLHSRLLEDDIPRVIRAKRQQANGVFFQPSSFGPSSVLCY
ncbi:unnamed protein product, partial [Durusdinium trenchii]